MTQDIEPLLIDAARRGAHYLAGLGERQVAPSAQAVADLSALGGALPEAPADPQEVLRLLDTYGSPATVASAGARYFGFVTGGSLPTTVAATVMVAAWDQNAALDVMSPVAAALEQTAGRWIVGLLGLPETAAVGFTTGATMANLTGLAAARQAVLARTGWDLAEQGLAGSPPICIVVGEEVHVSVLKALNLLGIGRAQLVRVPADDQGRMRPDAFPATLHGPAIVCLQAGNVNTGAIDPLRELCERAHALGAWVHIDGAFGLWARASPPLARLVDGAEQADSWAADAHKWLNVPYDCGIVIVRDPLALQAAMAASAAYLAEGKGHDGPAFVPDFSRRARGVEVWAALRQLGCCGIADLVDRCCRLARGFAERLEAAGFEILNDVALNQVMVSFGDGERTRTVIAGVQDDGTCWCGGTVWRGRTAMRISVSSWATTEDDVDRSVEAIMRVAQRHR